MAGDPCGLRDAPLDRRRPGLGVVILTHNGETNWFEGVLLLGLYAMLALAFFYVPAAAH